ncbi:hypothetical protein V1517DRAFT_376901 [Lipomyces orientalis]|uniref:Uncharacterized protein n=1 Tax=Lipomyces orientalis TaxID=1233043 RepID=A0ACC3TCR1_9ASCO
MSVKSPIFELTCFNFGALVALVSGLVYTQTGNDGAGRAVLATIFLFYGVAWTGLMVAYCSEILRVNLRAKVLAICFGVITASGVLNQYVNPIGLSNAGWKFYFRLHSYTGIARLFDGEDANVAGEESTKDKVRNSAPEHLEFAK